MNKVMIREEMLKKRDALSEEELIRRSTSISDNLKSLEEYKKASTVMFYVSKGSEVHTHNLINGTNKVIVVPKMKDGYISCCAIEDFSELRPGSFGILEPVKERIVDLSSIGFIIVPGIAFDIKGYRVGYGFGYYDTLLKRLTCMKVWLAFDFQVISKISFDRWDVKLDKVITETM